MNKLFLATILLIGFGKANSYPIGPSECDLCQVFVTGGKNFLSHNHTVDELKNYLDVTCDFFGPYRDTCKFFVGEFTPKIIDLIHNNDTAIEVCSKVDACNDNECVTDLFEDVINTVEAYDPATAYANAYATAYDTAYAYDSYESDNIIYEKVNDIKPTLDSLPVFFELIDFGDI